MRTRIAAIAAVAAIAVAGAGCGGGDDDSSTTALSKDEFVTQANQICADGNDKVDAAAKDVFSSGQPSQDDVNSFVTDTVIPNIQDQIDQIRALGIPEGDEDQVNAILDSAQSDIDAAKEDPTIISDAKGDPFKETNKLAAAYGLNECANG
jgi:hypothetical protein